MDTENNDRDDQNNYINQLTLNFLISKHQLDKLNKMKQKDCDVKPIYDKEKISELFNKLLNNNAPDDLLEDVKTCFDAFIEKSIYYLEIHDKNECIQNERNDLLEEGEDIDDDDEDDKEEEDDGEDEDEDEEEEDEDVNEEYFVEEVPSAKSFTRVSTKYNLSNGVEDIHKLPLDWFNTTRQNYKINQIIHRKKEISFTNSNIKKQYNR